MYNFKNAEMVERALERSHTEDADDIFDSSMK